MWLWPGPKLWLQLAMRCSASHATNNRNKCRYCVKRLKFRSADAPYRCTLTHLKHWIFDHGRKWSRFDTNTDLICLFSPRSTSLRWDGHVRQSCEDSRSRKWPLSLHELEGQTGGKGEMEENGTLMKVWKGDELVNADSSVDESVSAFCTIVTGNYFCDSFIFQTELYFSFRLKKHLNCRRRRKKGSDFMIKVQVLWPLCRSGANEPPERLSEPHRPQLTEMKGKKPPIIHHQRVWSADMLSTRHFLLGNGKEPIHMVVWHDES